MRRVVVTGMGMLSPLGDTVAESWQNILAAKSGVKQVDTLDVSEYPSKISGSVRNFDPSPYLTSKEARKLDSFVQFAVVASCQAIEDAGLVVTPDNERRIGVAIGSGIGGLPAIEKNHHALIKGGPRKISPFFIPGAIINMAAGYISIMKGLKGPTLSITTACTTSAHNIGQAARMISCGDADVMLAGGAEMATCPLGLGGFAAMRALSTRNDEPEKASRPWDKDRDGFVLADGAGVLVLEEYEVAKARGATIYAELSGFGMSSDAYHISSPDEHGDGFCHAMMNALNDAKMTADAIDYINAHATSTPMGDGLELMAVNRMLGDHRANVAMSSTKSMTGHLLGAAGAVECIFSILALRDQVAPPTINLDNPENADGINLVPHEAQPMTINTVMSNSFGFGGTNGSLIFTKLT